MRHILLVILLVATAFISLGQPKKDSSYYLKASDPVSSFIPLKEGYKLFSQSFGTGKTKILLLHGGPFNGHEYFEIFKEKLPLDKFQIIYYDQLGSYYSDMPKDTGLWNIPRFVDEVEQVRSFYNLDSFYLLGHSWGGLLAMEYAIKYPDKLRGLIISNKSYSQANLVTTRKELTLKIAENLNCSQITLYEIRTGQLYSDTLEQFKIDSVFNRDHLMRLDSMPDAMTRYMKHITGGRYFRYLKGRGSWNILDRLHLIQVPTLIIGSKYDFVKESELREMQERIKNSTLYICPNGGHMVFWDDSTNYFKALTKFTDKVNKRPYR